MFSINRLVFVSIALVICLLTGCEKKYNKEEFDQALQKEWEKKKQEEIKIKEEVNKRFKDEEKIKEDAIREEKVRVAKYNADVLEAAKKLNEEKAREKPPVETKVPKDPELKKEEPKKDKAELSAKEKAMAQAEAVKKANLLETRRKAKEHTEILLVKAYRTRQPKDWRAADLYKWADPPYEIGWSEADKLKAFIVTRNEHWLKAKEDQINFDFAQEVRKNNLDAWHASGKEKIIEPLLPGLKNDDLKEAVFERSKGNDPYMAQKEKEVDAILAIHKAYFFDRPMNQLRIANDAFASNAAYEAVKARKQNNALPVVPKNYYKDIGEAVFQHEKRSFNAWEKVEIGRFEQSQQIFRQELLADASLVSVRLNISDAYVKQVVRYVDNRRKMGLPP